MLRFAVRRLLLLIPILFGLSILVFLFVRALPGGPETALLGERATPERVAAVRTAYGLDRPLYQQYSSYIGKVSRGDFGTSIQTQQPVSEEIGRRFPATVELAFVAILFAVLVGIPLGFVAGRRPGSWIDNLSTVGSLLGIAIPVFALGFLLKYVFAVRLGWLPSSGRQDVTLTTEHPTGFFVLDGLLTGDLSAAGDPFHPRMPPRTRPGRTPATPGRPGGRNREKSAARTPARPAHPETVCPAKAIVSIPCAMTPPNPAVSANGRS